MQQQYSEIARNLSQQPLESCVKMLKISKTLPPPFPPPYTKQTISNDNTIAKPR